ncbi:hypothetical protein C0991_012352 [Blastosporella zonata]|nr:hypothetical protein C0991_012352 [Blastosporella zonata]
MEKLKAGLGKLKAQIKTRKNNLLKCLKAKEAISNANEHWLDNNANIVDEERVLEALKKASDYERGLEQLTPQQKGLVARLKELGGAVKDSVGNKRKCDFPGPVKHQKVPEKTKKAVVPKFTHKERATYKQKVQILDWHHKQGPKQSQGHTVAHWDKIYPNLVLKQPVISDWVKNETPICALFAEAMARGGGRDTKCVRQVKHPEVNEMLEL